MDTARAAKRNAGVEHVYLIYRRTRRYMPADEEELVMALEDGVEFKELLSPVKLENGQLFCKVMQLSDRCIGQKRSDRDRGDSLGSGRYGDRCSWRKSADRLVSGKRSGSIGKGKIICR